MSSGPLLLALVVVVLFAPALLFATTLLERLIVLPVLDPLLLEREKLIIRINRKER